LPREASADPVQIRRLLAQLDDELFTTRERATRELAAFGDAAEPLLREYLATTTSPEASQRLEVLLESIRAGTFDADPLRALRAVEILERIGSAEARAALQALATGQ